MGSLNAQFFFDVFSIVLVNILLSGDNAVVIAMAVKSLPAQQRKLGVLIGAGGAALLRIVLTFFAARLLTIHYVQFLGGLLILWIAVKLLTDSEGPEEQKHAVSLWHATWMILVADVTMSIDNVLAIAGISKGNLVLLIFGLGVSIAFVMFTSTLLIKLMDRYPIVLYLGSAILGRVGGEMMMSDPWIQGSLAPSRSLEIAVEIGCAIAVIVVAKAVLAVRGGKTPADRP